MTLATNLELTTVRQLFRAEIERGIETGVTLSVSFRGEVVDVVDGENGSGAPMSVDTTVPWTCSSKPLGAIAFAAAWEAGEVDLDTRVVEVLPDFVGGGKEQITVRDVLTHCTGIPEPLTSLDTSGRQIGSWADVDALIWSTICGAGTVTRPGTAMSYNPVTNWFVLDRLLTTLSSGERGDSQRVVIDRLGLSATLGADWALPDERRVTVSASADQQAGLEAMQLVAALPLPGAGLWGSMRDLRVVGEVLAHRGVHHGERIIGAATVEAMTATHWPGTRHRAVCDTDFPYGLGVMTLPLVLGQRCSVRVFGHAGGNTSTLIVDPLFDLVVAVYWNGRLNDARTIARRYALVRALHHDLGLARP
ncbi:MAG: hypothetical protein AVDCRST_MAG66-320 [uncultured Pseudonocardia sp.]|uniref:Beta-lactamase-related domain-containing protein n=1 Tax=uncultured Pseudonocardia sp. TaxID=211455 RepID=A0A6J4NAX8_9PSEU|nr:MAG: hypothetical protein AVDCRST_MAG66-320 [uncultured Pseudonocardia sp.]